MCIRDRLETFRRTSIQELTVELEKVETLAYRKVTELIFGEHHPYGYNSVAEDYTCLLYTSDAADERSSVDLGGRRIIKKKNISADGTTLRTKNENKKKVL